MTNRRVSMIYGALALVVAGPLLRPGLILAVDLNPVPRPNLPSIYWGLPTGTHGGPVNRLPIDMLFVELGHIGAVGIAEKLLLIAIIFLAGSGMHRLAPTRHDVGRYFAGILYAVNPFVYDRLVTGQWYLLLGYALLPWSFAALRPLLAGDWRQAWRFAAWATAVGVASPHMFGLLGVLVVAATAARVVRPGRREALTAIALGCVLTGLASLYWLIPTPGVSEFWSQVGTAQLRLYGTVADHTWGTVATVLGLSGYWNDADPIRAHLFVWPLIAVSLVMLASWGLLVRRRDPNAWAVTAAAACGVLLALGTKGPLTGSLFRLSLEHLSFLRSFREPQKGVALLVFGYAYLGAAAAGELREHARGWGRRAGVVVAAVALLMLPLIGGYRELGGLWGGLSTSAYPKSWSGARAQLNREAASSRTLVLPWHGYLALSFAGHRVVANPSGAFFNTPVLVSRSVGEGAATDTSDPVDATVSALLADGARRRDLGACLASLGISHVLLEKQADWARYSFLTRQHDLILERRWSDLLLYRNTHPTSLAPQVTHLGTGICDTRVKPLPIRPADPAHLELTSAPRRGSLIAFTSQNGQLWRLGDSRARQLAPSLELIASDGHSHAAVLDGWNGLRFNYLLGLLGLMIAAGSALTILRRDSGAKAAASRLDGSRLCVVLPTYNEATNVRQMVDALRRVFAQHNLDGSVLIVDDDSPDGTGRIAAAMSAADPKVNVLHRAEKNGLGRAYVAGFDAAVSSGADLIVQMDCDFSHDPADIPRLVAACAESDVALGSRYVDGGSVLDWGLGRRMLSRLGCAYARRLLGVGVRDLTGGLKCFRADTLRMLDLASTEANGYGFQIEVTHRAIVRGLKVQEVPIVFRDRTTGDSKMSWRIAVEALLLVPRLRLAHLSTSRPTQRAQLPTDQRWTSVQSGDAT